MTHRGELMFVMLESMARNFLRREWRASYLPIAANENLKVPV
jgi:hypothetical protein